MNVVFDFWINNSIILYMNNIIESLKKLFKRDKFLHNCIANYEKKHNVKIFQDNFEKKILNLINTPNSPNNYKPAFINQLKLRKVFINQLKSSNNKKKTKSTNKGKGIMKGKRKRKTMKGGQWRNYIKTIIAVLFAMVFIQIIMEQPTRIEHSTSIEHSTRVEQPTSIDKLFIIFGLFYVVTNLISKSLILTVEIVDMAKENIKNFLINHFSNKPELSRPTEVEIRAIVDALFIDDDSGANSDITNSDTANTIVAVLLDTIEIPTPELVLEVLENTAINRYYAENAVEIKEWEDKHIEDPDDDVYAVRCARRYW